MRFQIGGIVFGAFALAGAACGGGTQTDGVDITSTKHTTDPGVDAGAPVTRDAGGATIVDAAVAADTGSPRPDAGAKDAAPPPAQTCNAKTGKSGEITLNMPNNRSAIVHVPSTYDPSKPTMLVMNLHGLTMDPTSEEILTGMNDIADQRNFIVVYPTGIDSSWNAGDCCGTARDQKLDDVGFVKSVLDEVEKEYCVDTKRVFATGMSNGGFLSHLLGCRMADTFAAIAPVAGVLGIPPADCKPSRPLPVLEFHGTADPLVPYGGGSPNIGPLLQVLFGDYTFRSVADTIGFWTQENSCTGNPATTYQKGDTTCQKWSTCSPGNDVTLCTIDGGGHAWPGGFDVAILGLGKTSTDIDATTTIIDFFDAHPMP